MIFNIVSLFTRDMQGWPEYGIHAGFACSISTVRIYDKNGRVWFPGIDGADIWQRPVSRRFFVCRTGTAAEFLRTI
ncbi:MAG: hypothetical protein J0I60_12450 [Nitrosospira sp.]|nr:hypothetical protein [Nitrosospira sp.]